MADSYPAPYRQSIITTAKARKLDPRFILALIKQESVFRPTAKSPAGARACYSSQSTPPEVCCECGMGAAGSTNSINLTRQYGLAASI